VTKCRFSRGEHCCNDGGHECPVLVAIRIVQARRSVCLQSEARERWITCWNYDGRNKLITAKGRSPRPPWLQQL
jgi:hypothetical protein